MERNIYNMSQGPPNPGFTYAGKSTKSEFSKKALSGIGHFFLIQDRMNPSNIWKGKLEVASFFLPSKNL